MRADWQALVQYLQDDCLALSLNDRGKFGYSRAYDGMTHDGHEFTLWCDGNMGADPSVHGRGKHSPGIASMLRSLPYSHTVSRVDSAIEFEGEGTWDALYSCLLAFAEEHHIKRSSFNDLEEGAPHGRTLYIGSRKSPAFLRCYEKGKQLGNPKSTWVRVELVIRPQKNQRVEASRATPDNIWGYCRWASLLAPLLVEGFAPQLIRADTKKSKDELDVRLVKAFQRHRNLFTNGICKYGEEDFCEMMFTALGRRSTVTASDWG
ncbi:MAG: replication initiation factor domain-containing protein [Propionibacteriaceae bacterium]|nr:replication initiation factor domain-containing protein [Propionibacteriaceae bacterium]